MMRKKPELLSPAGDMEKLKMAVAYGADAVYLAGTSFGMRSFAGNFSPEELPLAVAYAHDHGVRVHVTVNTMPRSGEVDALPAHLERLNDAGVDALILADLGAFTLAGKYAPRCERHISTQQSIANYACAQAWYDLGAKRVVLARELSMDEIREIRRRTSPELELETFCHGAMCVSYSGRCLLSNYMTGRDSNRGACAQPCRYQYALMEEKRPGEYFPVFEDEKGTYIMNSRDMCMIDHLDDLMDAGVDCLDRGPGQIRLLCCHRHRGLPPCHRRRGAGPPRRPRLAGRGGARQPPPLFHRLFLRPSRPVLRELPLYPGLADLRCGNGMHPGGAGHPEPPQQVPHRRYRGGGGAGYPSLLPYRAGDDGCRRTAPL